MKSMTSTTGISTRNTLHGFILFMSIALLSTVLLFLAYSPGIFPEPIKLTCMSTFIATSIGGWVSAISMFIVLIKERKQAKS